MQSRAPLRSCVSPGTLWALDRAGFREAQKNNKGIDVIKVLSKVSELSMLRFDQLQELRDAMREESFSEGDYVMRQGEAGETFYVTVRGSAVVRVQRPGGEEEDIAVLSEQMCFGEKALLEKAPRGASVVALEELHCMTLERDTFERVLGPLQKLIDDEAKKRENTALKLMKQQQAAGLSAANHVGAFHFRRCARDSSGHGPASSYLSSYLVSLASASPTAMRPPSGGPQFGDSSRAPESARAPPRSGSSREYTLRVASKAKVIDNNGQQDVLSELLLLKQLAVLLPPGQACLPHLLASFHDPAALYWVFNCRAAVALDVLLKRATLGEDGITFLIACAISALTALHAHEVMLRGLSLPLLMVDEAGYLLITDFRWARQLCGEQSYSMVGLPEYLAPEQVRGEGHSFSVDWWAVGTFAYELLMGRAPFVPADGSADGKELQVAQAVLEHRAGSLSFDGAIGPATSDLQALTQALVCPDVLSRLGRTGADEVHAHKAFAAVNFAKLQGGLLPSPLAASLLSHLKEGDREQGIVEPPRLEPCLPHVDQSWCVDFETGGSASA